MCFNCKAVNRENDKFCRNCGFLMRTNTYYILINIATSVAIIALIFVIVLFIASLCLV